MVCLSCPFHLTLPSDPSLILFQWTLRRDIITKKVRPSFRIPYASWSPLLTSRPFIDVGRAIRDSGVPRSSVFLTSKYMPSHTVYSPTEVLDVVRKSLNKVDRCGGDKPYIDLMLIHAPWGGEEGRKNNWEALTMAQKEGWVKDIGVSNLCVLAGAAVQWFFSLCLFSGVHHLKALPPPVPAVNQIELHPFCQQRNIVKYCEEHGIAIEAYSPLVRANKKYYDNAVLVKVAKKHGKEVAQVLLRWSLQKGWDHSSILSDYF